MFKLFDAQNVLEHVVELLFGKYALRRAVGIEMAPGVAATWYAEGALLVVAVNEVKLDHPRAEHRLLAQAVDLGQTAHPLFYIVLEHVTKVGGREGTRLHHLGDAVRFKEHLVVAAHSVRERLVRLDVGRHLGLQEQVEALLQQTQVLLGDFGLSPHHVRGLLRNERVRNAAAHKHVDLQTLLVDLDLLEGFVLLGGQRGRSSRRLLVFFGIFWTPLFAVVV